MVVPQPGIFLDAQGHGGGHHAGQKRILGVIFKIPAAERVPVDVHARSQPQGNLEFLHLAGDHFTHFPNQVHIPRSGLTAYPPEWRCSTDSTWFPADLSALRKSRFQTHPENRRRRWIRLHAPDKSGGAGVRPGPSARTMLAMFQGSSWAAVEVSAAAPGTVLSGGSEGAFSLLVFGRIPGGQRDQLVNRQGVHQFSGLRRGIGRAERSKRQFLSGISDRLDGNVGQVFSPWPDRAHACSREADLFSIGNELL